MNKILRSLFVVAGILSITSSYAADDSMDSDGYPVMYLKGGKIAGGWNDSSSDYRFSRSGNQYTLTVNVPDGQFKISSDNWGYNLGAGETVTGSTTISCVHDGGNITASGLGTATISFSLYSPDFTANGADVTFTKSGGSVTPTPQPDPDPNGYITVYWDNSSDNWSTVYVHYWGPNGENSWPGNQMNKVSDTVWTYTIPAGSTGVVFNACESPQTGDLTPVHNHVYNSTGDLGLYNGPTTPITPKPEGLSGTLPVLYINAYKTDAEGAFILDGSGNKVLENEIIDMNLSHKNYFSAEYWLDVNGCQWMIDLGAESIGSADEPLPTEIKARGNYTRTAFAKKPFKLKLGKKQNLLNININGQKSKHWAILAHADDVYGYLRNFIGFNLGERIGLPWTPRQQPIEVVINGNYRGLYFLTESIRVGDGRVPVQELKDNEIDKNLISGGYIVELDNYDEDNQIQFYEQSCVGGHYIDKLRVTFDTPEEYSDAQRRFISEQFSFMNTYVGQNNNELWRYLDLDDAVRYYLCREIISDVESFHGSTYLFRDRGEGQKWHFSPLWDCGNAFNGSTDQFFYDCDPYGNTWIPSLRANPRFNEKLMETWAWFMGNEYEGLIADIDAYVGHIAKAAIADRQRWRNSPYPGSPVVDNSDMTSRRNSAVNHLNAKISWLTRQWGSPNPSASEPERDDTPAAKLPDYATTDILSTFNDNNVEPIYFDLTGRRVAQPQKGQFYIERRGASVAKKIY